MFKFKNFINEWGGVSDDNLKISKYIVEAIKNDLMSLTNDNRKISDTVNTRYVENSFSVKLPTYKNIHTKNINIHYLLYETDSQEESNFILKKLEYGSNCEWDENTQTMNIVSALINGKPSDDLLESIIHETNHLFEYSIGMEKDEDRYSKIVEIIGKRKGDAQYFIALALYYTFKHERNSFVQQFYQFLVNQKTLDKNFDDIIYDYKPWVYFENALTAADVVFNNALAMQTMNTLGYSRKQYYKRLSYSYEKFYQKLKNVYRRRKIEINSKNLKGEAAIKHSIFKLSKQIMLSEGQNFNDKLNSLIPFEIEFFFKN